MDIYWSTRTGLVPTDTGTQQPVGCLACRALEDLTQVDWSAGGPTETGKQLLEGEAGPG